jgi:hypothetical protein
VRARAALLALAVAPAVGAPAATAAAATAKAAPPVSLSCTASASFCVAVSLSGEATTYKRGAWTQPVSIDASAQSGQTQLDGVSCGSPSLCLALDQESGDIYTDRDGAWSAGAAVDPDGGGLQALSCVSSSFCFTVDFAGQGLTYDGSTWSTPGPAYTTGTPASLSCASASFCVLGDDLGNVAEGAGGSWSEPIDIAGANPVAAVSCATRRFCAAAAGTALVGYEGGSWREPDSVGGGGVTSLSCSTASFCLAVDGRGLSGGGRHWHRVPAQLTGPSPSLVSCAGPACVELDHAGSAVRDRRGVWSELAALPGSRGFRPAGLVTVGRVRSTGSVARIPVRCVAATCRLTLTLRRGSTVLGGARRTLSADRRAIVKLELGAGGARALRRARRLRLGLVITEAGPGAVVRRHLAFTS